MYCPSCGTPNGDDHSFCTKCGHALARPAAAPPAPEAPPSSPYAPPSSTPYVAPGAQFAQPVNVPTYLAQSILVTLFCCIIPGVVGIIYASQVNGKLALGDLEGARNYSRLARNWSWAAFGLGIAFGLFYILMVVVGATLQK